MQEPAHAPNSLQNPVKTHRLMPGMVPGQVDGLKTAILGSGEWSEEVYWVHLIWRGQSERSKMEVFEWDKSGSKESD